MFAKLLMGLSFYSKINISFTLSLYQKKADYIADKSLITDHHRLMQYLSCLSDKDDTLLLQNHVCRTSICISFLPPSDCEDCTTPFRILFCSKIMFAKPQFASLCFLPFSHCCADHTASFSAAELTYANADHWYSFI